MNIEEIITAIGKGQVRVTDHADEEAVTTISRSTRSTTP